MASLGFHRNGSWTLWRMLAEYVTTQIIYPTFSWFPSESFQNSSIWDWNYFVSNVIHILFLWWKVVEEKIIRSISNVTFLRSLTCLLFTWKQEFMQLYGTLRVKEKLSCRSWEDQESRQEGSVGQEHTVYIEAAGSFWAQPHGWGCGKGDNISEKGHAEKNLLPWLFCELLERMHPNQKSFCTLSFPFALCYLSLTYLKSQNTMWHNWAYYLV